MESSSALETPSPSDELGTLRGLLELLRDQVRSRRVEHDAAVNAIAAHKNDDIRHFGARVTRNRHNLEKLKAHVDALDTRPRTQRELQVLVPLMRRVLACSPARPGPENGPYKDLNPFRTELARWACSTGKAGLYEKPVALTLLFAFPGLLGLPAKPATSSGRAVASGTGVGQAKNDERRLSLYNKISSSGILSGKEQEHLRIIFWGE